jgi:transcription elongation factor GreA
MSLAEKRKAILAKIEDLKVQINDIGTDIEHERNESSEEDSAIKQELLDKKEIREQQVVELKNSLILMNNSNFQMDVNITYTIEINGSKRELSVVLPTEADPGKGMISIESPLAKALTGRQKGDVVDVETPAGVQKYKITNVQK